MFIVWNLLRETFAEAGKDNVPRLGAALAFYAALSLSPLLLLIMAIAGFFVDDQSALAEQLVSQMRTLAGDDGAGVVASLLKSDKSQEAGIVATVLGLLTLAFGATGMIAELQGALDTVWDTGHVPRPAGVWSFIKSRLASLGVIFGMAVLLLASMIASAVLAAVTHAIEQRAPGLATALQTGNTVLSLGLATLLFALVYRMLPYVPMTWSDVWLGAILTGGLFSMGKYGISAYLGYVAVGSAYGPAGSFVVLLVWIYYSFQIFLLGAEFTEIYSRRHGSRARSS